MSQDTGNQSVAETSSEDIPQPNSRYVRTLLVVVIFLAFCWSVGAIVVIGTVIAGLIICREARQWRGIWRNRDIHSGIRTIARRGKWRYADYREIKDRRRPAMLILLDPRKGEETGRVRLQAR